MLLDKSLPSLPPSAVSQNVFSPENESPPSESYSETPTELPPTAHKMTSNLRSRSETGVPAEIPRGPPKRPPNFRSHSSRSEKRERSPVTQEDEHKGTLGGVASFNAVADYEQTTSHYPTPPIKTTDTPFIRNYLKDLETAKDSSFQWHLIRTRRRDRLP